MRWIGNQQLNVEIKVGNFTEVSLQHLAISQYPDPLTVVVDFIMNELFQLRPVLLIQAGNVVSVDVAEVGFHHGNFPCASTCSLLQSRTRLRFAVKNSNSEIESAPSHHHSTS